MKPKGNILLIFLFVTGIVAASAGGYLWWQNEKAKNEPLTWEECTKVPNAKMLLSYPGQCIAPDGRKVVQPLSEDERKRLEIDGGAANWKTFTDSGRKFTFQYPEDFVLEQIKYGLTLRSSSYKIEVQYFDMPPIETVGEFLKMARTNAMTGETIDVKSQTTKAGGREELIVEPLSGGHKTYYIRDDNFGVAFYGAPLNNISQNAVLDQILSTFKFLDQGSGRLSYSCPANGWANCMPILSPEAQKGCTQEAFQWYKENCPGYQGVAY